MEPHHWEPLLTLYINLVSVHRIVESDLERREQLPDEGENPIEKLQKSFTD